MPKETIGDEAGMYDVTVGWERDKWVQIGLVTSDGQTLVGKLAETQEGDAPQAAVARGRIRDFLEAMADPAGEFIVRPGDPAIIYAQSGGGSGETPLLREDLETLSLPMPGVIAYAEFDGIWGTLDRARINQLIRVLRRARDQAYGQDA